MFTTIKNRLAKAILAASIILILTIGPTVPAAFADPACSIIIPGC